ncbi:MAG: hypothetical protein AVDCRST_MAG53-1903 [uncultured Solirubrobacteraceae bacterium]|uniref:SnoaL-like domain-containing protein n=1 Tax=uncultured Solirubrobacteraceae bacterium TaxID=1162706 RepID=A0A6J4SJJ4_9ACTN|nr:MAG: hypothetical protein AVDCRST_MAG53-1903 [uncultured Solirubrobacteraceae bacterium]
MDRREMDGLIEQHIAAEMAGDTAGAVAMYTEDVVHDVIGSPTGPVQGPAAAQGFYDYLTANVRNDDMRVTHSWYGEDFCVIEHQCDAAITGEFLGVPGHGREISFRMLHVWEFRDDRISRENVWLDGGSIVAQLTAPGPAPVPG